jgi:hypothetical protein
MIVMNVERGETWLLKKEGENITELSRQKGEFQITYLKVSKIFFSNQSEK